MAIKLPPNWCKVALNFCSVCYNLSEIFSFRSLNMDYVITNSADPDEMTHREAFHLGLPCSIKYPIRVFWYTNGIQRLNISYIVVQRLPCFTTDQIRYSFYCGRLFREDSNSFLICQKSRPLAAMFLRDQVCFICFVVGHR